MTTCRVCRSHAINPHLHGRTEAVDLDLCDVCYWRSRAEAQAEELKALRGYLLEEHRVGGMFSFSKKYGLIDENGNPTPLLTGETSCKS